jgi:serine/threonine protein kinase
MNERTQPISEPAALERTAELRTEGPTSDPAMDASRQEGGSGTTEAQSAKTVPAAGALLSEASEDEALAGRILAGRYQLDAVLGRGGMGVVYSGRHIAIDRAIAVKVLRRDLARSSDAVARFHREARAAASIGSPHIVEVFDFGFTDEGDAFIAMERLDGTDLRKLVRESGPLAPARAIAIARQIAKGLAAAHARGIIHRDLKSENVFVCRRDTGEHVKLLDFGISKVTELDDSRGPLTSEGVVMGTPHYMAPELLHGATAADARADVYALGCVLYEMLTGAVPFSGKTPMEVAYKHVHEPVEPPSRRRPGLSPTLDALALRALEKNVHLRIASAEQFIRALDELEHEPRVTAPSPAPAEDHSLSPMQRETSANKPHRRRSSTALIGAAAAAVVLGVAAAVRVPVPAAGVSTSEVDAGAAAPVRVADDRSTAERSIAPSREDVAPSEVSSGRVEAEDVIALPLPDAASRRIERGASASPNGGSSAIRAAVDAQVELAEARPDVVQSVASVLDAGVHRGPDDGLKQTPYGRLAR